MNTKARSALTLGALVMGLAAGLACAGPRPPPSPEKPQSAPPAAAAPVIPETPAVPAAPPAAPAVAGERAIRSTHVPPGPDRTHPPPLGPAPELHVPPQVHFALANGLRVRLVEHHRLPIIALQLVVNGGASLDPKELPGLASFTAGMLAEGTRTRTATQISDQVGFLGASLGAGAGQDAAFLSGSSLARQLPALLQIFADVAMNPTFPRKDFLRVQDQRKVTLLQQRDQPGVVASKAFTGVFWGDASPYGHFPLGTEASVAAITPADLARFHARHWRPANAELVVVGDVTEAALRPLLERTLGTWRAGAALPPPPPTPPSAPHRTVLIEKADAPQSYLLLGMPGLLRTSPDVPAATVAFQVLGGGTSSRLFRHLREEKGYTYGMAAGADARRLAGASLVRGSVKADVTGPALQDLIAELGRLRDEPVPEAELADARNAIVLSLPGDFSTVGGIAGRVAELVVHGLPDDYWTRYAEAVKRVTAADVQRVAARVLDLERLTLVVVGQPSVVRPQLAGLALGELEVRAAPAPVRKLARPGGPPRPPAR